MNSSQQVQSAVAAETQTECPTMPAASSFGERAPRILRLKDVIAVVGLKRSAIYARISNGSFPQQIKVGGARASGWVSTEIFAWVEEQIQRSRPT